MESPTSLKVSHWLNEFCFVVEKQERKKMHGHVLLPRPSVWVSDFSPKRFRFLVHNFHNLRGFRWLLCHIDLYSECGHYIAVVSAIRCVGFVLLMKVGKYLNKVSFILTVYRQFESTTVDTSHILRNMARWSKAVQSIMFGEPQKQHLQPFSDLYIDYKKLLQDSFKNMNLLQLQFAPEHRFFFSPKGNDRLFQLTIEFQVFLAPKPLGADLNRWKTPRAPGP